eukprot:scaffold18229_cov49-Cylindrotheca_fusiformis.AAC.1
MISKLELNFRAIDLNNAAIERLKDGKIIEAFQMLSFACRRAVENHFHAEAYYRTYQYEWVDCSASLARGLDGLSSFNEG